MSGPTSRRRSLTWHVPGDYTLLPSGEAVLNAPVRTSIRGPTRPGFAGRRLQFRVDYVHLLDTATVPARQSVRCTRTAMRLLNRRLDEPRIRHDRSRTARSSRWTPTAATAQPGPLTTARRSSRPEATTSAARELRSRPVQCQIGRHALLHPRPPPAQDANYETTELNLTITAAAPVPSCTTSMTVDSVVVLADCISAQSGGTFLATGHTRFGNGAQIVDAGTQIPAAPGARPVRAYDLDRAGRRRRRAERRARGRRARRRDRRSRDPHAGA